MFQLNKIRDGDKVRFNKRVVKEFIKSNQDVMSDLYQKWVVDNLDKTFTARIYRNDIFTLEEDISNPKWLFLRCHLIKVKRRKSRNEG